MEMCVKLQWSIVILYLCSLSPSGAQYRLDTHYQNDDMNEQDKMRMINITQEIVKDAHLKIRQVTAIREVHSGSRSFDIGLIMGSIREKYRHMTETYRQTRDKDLNRSIYYPPTIDTKFQPIYYITAMETVRSIEKEIDKLVHVLETIKDDELNPDLRYVYLSRTTTRRGRGRGLRAHDIEIIRRMAEEQELKSRMREKHLLRKLGQPLNQHTTAKRFQHRWPVDENWDLGLYGDFGLY